jgi:hypothetical protein
MRTKDGFDKVVEFYEQALGGNLRLRKPGAVKMVGTSTFVLDDSHQRPLQLRVFVHHAKDYSVTIVISRAKDEALTHIVMVCREMDKRK